MRRSLYVLPILISILLVGIGVWIWSHRSSNETLVPQDAVEVSTTQTDVSSESIPSTPVIYVSFASHSEDPAHPDYPSYVEDRQTFDAHRAALVDFANLLHTFGVAYNFQTDWNFILGVQAFDQGDTSTNGKNILRYLVEDLKFSVDPHSHEGFGYNIADVAYLLTQVGVTPSTVAGGFIADPPSASLLERYWKPVEGKRYDYVWAPTVLFGGGTSKHVNESLLWMSGMWRPKSNEEFLVHDPAAAIPVVGHYRSTWEGLERLVEKQAAGELDPMKMYTVTVMANQADMNTELMKEWTENLERYRPLADQGLIQWVLLQDTLRIWQDEFDEQPSQLLFDGEEQEENCPPLRRLRGGCE
jgi:hypothetical protein